MKQTFYQKSKWAWFSCFFLFSMVLAQAQGPITPKDVMINRRPVQGDTLTFCVNPETLLAGLNRGIAEEIARVMLSKAKFHNVTPTAITQPLDYSFPINESELLVYLTDFCQVFTGFSLVSGAGPDWLTYSRDYVQTGFVLVTINPKYQNLEDIPHDQAIGARFLSAADLKLLTYMQSLPEDRRWKRFNLFNNKVLIDKLLDGTIAAALIWEPALKVGLKGNPKANLVRIIPTGNFQPPTIRFGMALRSNETYLRTLLDQAIASLIKDGTIERLLQKYEIPGKVEDLEIQTSSSNNRLIFILGAVILFGLGLLWRNRKMLQRREA